jgi:hypothetical protein
MGPTKKLAEQDAARRALELLDNAGSGAALQTDAGADTGVEEPSIL